MWPFFMTVLKILRVGSRESHPPSPMTKLGFYTTVVVEIWNSERNSKSCTDDIVVIHSSIHPWPSPMSPTPRRQHCPYDRCPLHPQHTTDAITNLSLCHTYLWQSQFIHLIALLRQWWFPSVLGRGFENTSFQHFLDLPTPTKNTKATVLGPYATLTYQSYYRMIHKR